MLAAGTAGAMKISARRPASPRALSLKASFYASEGARIGREGKERTSRSATTFPHAERHERGSFPLRLSARTAPRDLPFDNRTRADRSRVRRQREREREGGWVGGVRHSRRRGARIATWKILEWKIHEPANAFVSISTQAGGRSTCSALARD